MFVTLISLAAVKQGNECEESLFKRLLRARGLAVLLERLHILYLT